MFIILWMLKDWPNKWIKLKESFDYYLLQVMIVLTWYYSFRISQILYLTVYLKYNTPCRITTSNIISTTWNYNIHWLSCFKVLVKETSVNIMDLSIYRIIGYWFSTPIFMFKSISPLNLDLNQVFHLIYLPMMQSKSTWNFASRL